MIQYFQLQADSGVHRRAVQQVPARRERVEQEAHPGQQGALLLLLHIRFRTRVITCSHVLFTS